MLFFHLCQLRKAVLAGTGVVPPRDAERGRRGASGTDKSANVFDRRLEHLVVGLRVPALELRLDVDPAGAASGSQHAGCRVQNYTAEDDTAEADGEEQQGGTPLPAPPRIHLDVILVVGPDASSRFPPQIRTGKAFTYVSQRSTAV